MAECPAEGDAACAFDVKRQLTGTGGGGGNGQKGAAGGVQRQTRRTHGHRTATNSQRVTVRCLRDELDVGTDAARDLVYPGACPNGRTENAAVIKRNPARVVDRQGVKFHVRIGAASGIRRGDASCPSHAAIEL